MTKIHNKSQVKFILTFENKNGTPCQNYINKYCDPTFDQSLEMLEIFFKAF